MKAARFTTNVRILWSAFNEVKFNTSSSSLSCGHHPNTRTPLRQWVDSGTSTLLSHVQLHMSCNVVHHIPPNPPKRLLPGILLLLIVTCNIFSSSRYPLLPAPNKIYNSIQHTANTKHMQQCAPLIHLSNSSVLSAPPPDSTKHLAQHATCTAVNANTHTHSRFTLRYHWLSSVTSSRPLFRCPSASRLVSTKSPLSQAWSGNRRSSCWREKTQLSSRQMMHEEYFACCFMDHSPACSAAQKERWR